MTNEIVTAKLSTLQEAFCHEYLIDLNPRLAYIRAGYSENGAARSAKILLREDRIKGRIEALQKRRLKNVDVQAEEVLLELITIARVDITQAFTPRGTLRPLDEIPVAVRKAINSIEIFEEFEGTGKNRVMTGWTKRVRFLDKIKALELLGKHLALFKEVHLHTVDEELASLMNESKVRRLEREEERRLNEVEGSVVVEERDPVEAAAEAGPMRQPPVTDKDGNELVLNPDRQEGFIEVNRPIEMRGCPKCFSTFEGPKCTNCGLEVPRIATS